MVERGLRVRGSGLAGGVLSQGRVRTREEKGNVERMNLNPALWTQGPCSQPKSSSY